MKLLAIDPGPEKSGFILLNCCRQVDNCGILPNKDLLDYVHQLTLMMPLELRMALEMVDSYGMPVGKDVFETVYWTGRFDEAYGGGAERISRVEVKQHLCHRTAGVNDAVIRQRLIDLYGPGKDRAIGKKASPGPLYEVKSHMWAALAVGWVALDRIDKRDVGCSEAVAS